MKDTSTDHDGLAIIATPAVPTPWPAANEPAGGWASGQLHIIAGTSDLATPGVALQVAQYATAHGHPAVAILQRLTVAQALGIISAQRGHDSQQTQADLRAGHMQFVTDPELTMTRLRMICWQASADHGPSPLITVDDVAAIADATPAAIGPQLAHIAREIQAPLIAVCHLDDAGQFGAWQPLADQAHTIMHLRRDDQDAAIVHLDITTAGRGGIQRAQLRQDTQRQRLH